MQLRRSIAISIVVTLFSILPMGAQQIYSSVRSYLDGIVTLPIDSIIHKCDLLIAEGENAENQSKIAGLIFDYFTSSPIMGADGVAVHIADNYFLNKKLLWPNASSYPALFTFAEFNRESLIGNRAPSLDIEDIDGNSLSIPKGEKGLSLLYFFDDHCASCSKETPAIVSFLQHYDGAQPLTLYAVYTQSDKESWKKYADLHFNSITNPQVRVYNLWDPEAASSFHMKYGVLSTPRLFLVDQENRIVGRMLDSKAIVTMIENDNNYFESLNTLFDTMFENVDTAPATALYLANALYDRTKHDNSLFRETFYLYYNYLKNRQGYDFKESAVTVAENYILTKPEVWSENMISDATDMVQKFHLNEVGAIAADIRMKKGNGGEEMLLQSTNSDYTILFFNINACEICLQYKEELKKMMPMIRKSKAKVVSVFSWPFEEAFRENRRNTPLAWVKLMAADYDELAENYDIAVVPKIYLLDKEKRVLAKELTPAELFLFLNRLALNGQHESSGNINDE